jgi:hypothetical protein
MQIRTRMSMSADGYVTTSSTPATPERGAKSACRVEVRVGRTNRTGESG